jgi:hypothetical protein
MTKTYVIADLHGRYDLLELGMRTIVHDTSFFHSGDSIVTLGDYVDRGPQSRQIIEYLGELNARPPGKNPRAQLAPIATRNACQQGTSLRLAVGLVWPR